MGMVQYEFFYFAMAFSKSENVFARSVLCDEAISIFKNFTR